MRGFVQYLKVSVTADFNFLNLNFQEHFLETETSL